MASRRRNSCGDGDKEVTSPLSPKKLQRSITNQIVPRVRSPPSADQPTHSLALRDQDLAPNLTGILVQCRAHSGLITSLDVSYSAITGSVLARMCAILRRLRKLSAVSCGLRSLAEDTAWPRKLRSIDLSRNALSAFPPNMQGLLYLEQLNLSGNVISNVDPLLLRLPSLRQLFLLSNPISNVPKIVCRGGVGQLREYLKVEPFPPPAEEEEEERFVPKQRRISVPERRRQLFLQHTDSIESGYESPLLCSAGSASQDSLHELETTPPWPKFQPDVLPQGYSSACQAPLCHIYLPDGDSSDISISVVQELSFHPQLQPNCLLVTPVIRVSPHGLQFSPDRPALIVLSHCTMASPSSQELIPLCSNTGDNQSPQWRRLYGSTPTVFERSVMFTTTHFSLFAVSSELPYPSARLTVCPGQGGTLTLPELPGVQVTVPSNGCSSLATIQTTVYYANHPYHSEEEKEEELAMASACIGLEPHGMEFVEPVEISIPIPDFKTILEQFPGSFLQLQCLPFPVDQGEPDWKSLPGTQLSVRDTEGAGHVATFRVHHFSWFEVVWKNLLQKTLQAVGYGPTIAYRYLQNRSRYVSVRCQVLMTPPLQDLSFGLAVTVYKFGGPLSVGNYKWVVADSGDRRIFLKLGELEVALKGRFRADDKLEERELRKTATIDFTGENFCRRFEFALHLSADFELPVKDHQLIGKLFISQSDGTTPIELNLIKPVEETLADQPSVPTTQSITTMDITPPWTPNSDVTNQPSTAQWTPPLSHIFSSSSSSSSSPRSRPGKRRQRDRVGVFSVDLRKRRLIITDDDITDKHLLDIAREVGGRWEEVGVALGLDYKTVQNVAGTSGGQRSEYMRAFSVLQEWKSRRPDDFSYSVLASALEEAGLTGCAQHHCYRRLD